jgi:hypothetical protein
MIKGTRGRFAALVVLFATEAAGLRFVFAETNASYDPGDALMTLALLPGGLLIISAYLVLNALRLSGQAQRASPPPRPGKTFAKGVVGVLCGLAGQWLCLGAGPHVGPFFVIWGAVAQVVVSAPARLAVQRWLTRNQSAADKPPPLS